MYGDTIGVLHDQNADTPADSRCYLPNAAIGWKQPNAFYYPPAFHSKGLFFNNVNIRHFVVEPLFKNNTYDQYLDNYKDRYCVTTADMFKSFTDIDRQTELTDDDGTLTGLTSDNGGKALPPTCQTADPNGKVPSSCPTVSVNQDPFFLAPAKARECASDIKTLPPDNPADKINQGTALTSPYDYVSTVVYPKCAVDSFANYTSCPTSIPNVPHGRF